MKGKGSPREGTRLPLILVALVSLATFLVALIIAPFAGSFFAAVVLASVLHGAQRKLDDLLLGRTRIAALLITTGLVITVLIPLTLLILLGAREARLQVQKFDRLIEEEGVEGVARRVPEFAREPVRSGLYWLRGEEEIETTSSDEASAVVARPASEEGTVIENASLKTIARIALQVVQRITTFFIDLGILLLTLFFLLTEGHKLKEWALNASPLGPERSDRLLTDLRKTIDAVFLATVVTALIQTGVAGIGYWIAGAPSLPLVLLLTLIASMIPIVGGASITTATGLLMWAFGEPFWGIALALYGMTVVGLCDNLVKPYLAKSSLPIPGSVLLFAMIGGLAVFGPMGVIAGPLVVAFFLGMLRIVREVREEGASAAAEPS